MADQAFAKFLVAKFLVAKFLAAIMCRPIYSATLIG